MGYRSKKAVLDGIAVRQRMRNGAVQKVYDAYLGYDPFDGRQRRMQSASLAELKARIHEFYAMRQSGGDAAARLRPCEAVDAREALDLLAQSRAHRSLTEAVRTLLRGGNAASGGCAVSAGEAYDAYYASFGSEQTHHRKAVSSRVGKWVVAFGRDRPLSDVTPQGLAAWLKSDGSSSAKTYNNRLTYVRSFFNWCMKTERGWIGANPAEGLETRRIAYREPEYMKPCDVERVFRELEGAKSARPDLLAYAVLSFFCGVRREEILRMATMPGAANVNLEDETVRIAKPKGWTKGVMPRAFPIQRNALAWMRSFAFERSVRRINERCADDVKGIARRAGVAMPKNAGRHTFITMHVAAYGDPAKTQAIVGTSAKMRAENYCGLASHRDGEAYFAIMPSRTAHG